MQLLVYLPRPKFSFFFVCSKWPFLFAIPQSVKGDILWHIRTPAIEWHFDQISDNLDRETQSTIFFTMPLNRDAMILHWFLINYIHRWQHTHIHTHWKPFFSFCSIYKKMEINIKMHNIYSIIYKKPKCKDSTFLYLQIDFNWSTILPMTIFTQSKTIYTTNMKISQF